MAKPFLHLLRIGLAYGVSALVTGYVVWASLLVDGSYHGREVNSGGPGFGLLITFMIAWLASGPAALTMCLGEALRWRIWWPYSIAGSLIGVVLGSMFQPPAFFPWLGLTFGLVSGGIYWAIAGRHAGLDDIATRRFIVIMLAAACAAGFLVSVPSLLGVRL